MKLYELKVVTETDEVFAISLVESPAIMSDFIYFNKEEVQFANVETEKKMLVGAILIPDRKIVRIDGEGQPYHVFFSKDTVKKLAQNYLMKKYTDKATLEHDKKIKGVHLVESWIKEGKLDKSNTYGLGNIPEGTWMGIFKVNDDKIWTDYVKTGKVKGFSVEALVEHELVKASLQMNTAVDDLEEQEAALILSQIKAIIRKDNRFKSKQWVEMETYNDYGSGVSNNAKRGRELNEKNGNKCATAVGKIRSSQLEKGENLSVQTIKRMYSYLSRAEAYYDESDMNACGSISFLLWGGKAGLSWSRNKLRELGLLEENGEPSISSSYPGEASSGSIAPALLD